MSLLLDALKKAEQSNQENSLEQTESSASTQAEQQQPDLPVNEPSKVCNSANEPQLAEQEPLSLTSDAFALKDFDQSPDTKPAKQRENLLDNTHNNESSELASATNGEIQVKHSVIDEKIDPVEKVEKQALDNNQDNDTAVTKKQLTDNNNINETSISANTIANTDAADKTVALHLNLDSNLDLNLDEVSHEQEIKSDNAHETNKELNEQKHVEIQHKYLDPELTSETSKTAIPNNENLVANPFYELNSNKLKQKRQRNIVVLSSIIFLIFIIAAWIYLSTTLEQLSKTNVHNHSPINQEADNTKTVVTPPEHLNSQQKPETDSIIINADVKDVRETQSNTKTNELINTKTTKSAIVTPNQTNQSVTISEQPDNQIITAKDNVYIADLSANQNLEKNTIKIKKYTGQTRLDNNLLAAYHAFQNKKFNDAKKLYSQYLANNPQNRDALLGLAAISLYNKEYLQAESYYYQLLQLDPKDSLALTGFLSLQKLSNIDLEATIAKLKFLLKQENKSAHIYFSLGNLYISQNRWIEAQSAFFNAFTLNSNKSDYAYNLAISLDQLNKPRNAIRYYQLALSLSKTDNFSFDKNIVRKRIKRLKGK